MDTSVEVLALPSLEGVHPAPVVTPPEEGKKEEGKKTPRNKGKKEGGKKTPEGSTPGKGLRTPQVRILRFLRGRSPTSRKVLSAGAKVDSAWVTTWGGSLDPVKRARNDALYFPSLVTLGYVAYAPLEEGGADRGFRITPKGEKALERLETPPKE